MKSFGKLFLKLLGFLLGFIGVGTMSLFPVIFAVGSFIATALLVTWPIDYLYGLLRIEIAGVVLPFIGYWSWFKIYIIIRLLFSGLSFVNESKKEIDKSKEKEKEKEKEKSPPQRTYIPPGM